MAIVPLPLPPGAEARKLVHHLLEHGDIVGQDAAGRTIIQLAVDDWVLEKLMGFGAEAAELEDGADDEPDADAEEDWVPVVLLDMARPRVIRRSGPERWHSVRSIDPMARKATNTARGAVSLIAGTDGLTVSKASGLQRCHAPAYRFAPEKRTEPGCKLSHSDLRQSRSLPS